MSEKKRFALWISDKVLEVVQENYQKDNCKTQSEYIEKAIRFYTGYLNTTHAEAYLPRIIAEVLEGKLTAFGNRIGALIFKLAVEQSITDNILAYYTDINEGTLKELHVKCTQDVMRTNGMVSFEDALKFQKDL